MLASSRFLGMRHAATRSFQPQRLLSTEAVQKVFSDLGLNVESGKPLPGVFDGESWSASGPVVDCLNPSTNTVLAQVQLGTAADLERCLTNLHSAKRAWAMLPAPKRGEVVRQLGDALRAKLHPLGLLISLEMGKIAQEGAGEVQEYVDMCEYSVGLSRTLNGLLLPSERGRHALLEAYNPRGALGVITAFNFPNAVAGWNTAVSLVCGNTQVIKGSESSNLINIATQMILNDVLRKNGVHPAVATLCQGRGVDVGEKMIQDERLEMVSFTGSTKVGRRVQEVVNGRFGATLLELGGNNAIVVQPNCNMENALRSALFAAVGTCGQRCTSLRRLLVHEDIYDEFVGKLVNLYEGINDLSKGKIGDPTEKGILVGPLHRKEQLETFKVKIDEIKAQGGKILSGGAAVDTSKLDSKLKNGNFVHPTLVEITHDKPIVFEENFMPICHVMKYSNLDEAIALNNSVDQGLSSALFSNDMRDVFKWIGPAGSDTGIVNVNTGCSGAEIGGAFGGNKHTGGGRESGSDAWKQYMRRSTCTINFGDALPLAQGIEFS